MKWNKQRIVHSTKSTMFLTHSTRTIASFFYDREKTLSFLWPFFGIANLTHVTHFPKPDNASIFVTQKVGKPTNPPMHQDMHFTDARELNLFTEHSCKTRFSRCVLEKPPISTSLAQRNNAQIKHDSTQPGQRTNRQQSTQTRALFTTNRYICVVVK